MTEVAILELHFNRDLWQATIVLNLWFVILIASVAVILILVIGRARYFRSVHRDIVPVKMKYSIGTAEIEYQIVRNYENVEIAHRIYVELITRKAALPIDEEQDVIVEVYNSWYKLFQLTRDEMKKLSGKLLLKNRTSEQLEVLLTDILNKGLRPHLTSYQAKFRKWYSEELEDGNSKGLSPQDIQKKYPEYRELIKSISNVNNVLMEYSKQLLHIIRR